LPITTGRKRRRFMRGKNALALMASFALVAAVSAQTARAPVFVPAADLKWVALDPAGAPGVMTADVTGNHATGAFSGFTKFPAGFKTPLHTHTSDFKIVVVEGTFVQTPEGKPEVRLGPGSYLLQPGGTYKHITACDQASECVAFIVSEGKFDLIPVDAPKK
jgi:quercetin dioxygenase-like cupin family protein